MVVVEAQLDHDPRLAGCDAANAADGDSQHADVIALVEAFGAGEGDLHGHVLVACDGEACGQQQRKDDDQCGAAQGYVEESAVHGRIPDRTGASVAGSVRFWM